jgi:hypothetical protein
MSPSGASADVSFISTWQQGERAVFLFCFDRRGISIWTDLVGGKRACVGMEIQPMCEAWHEATAQRARKWMQQDAETAEEVHGEPLPITRVWLRAVPLGAMMTKAARVDAEAETAPVGPPIVGVPVPGGVPSRGDRKRFEDRAMRLARTYDAITYVARVRAGSKTPARDVAAISDYSEAGARRRIAEARSLGLLTSAGVRDCELSEEAVSVIRQAYHIWPTKWLRTTARAAGLELDPEGD